MRAWQVALTGLGLLVGAVVVVLVVAVATGELRPYRIPSISMEPTLHPGDRVIACGGVCGSPRDGDIVVFHTPPAALEACGIGGVYVKRVVAAPGDRWRGRRVPPGEYALEGDNRGASCDSRVWGLVRRGAVIGKVVATWWPPGRITIR